MKSIRDIFRLIDKKHKRKFFFLLPLMSLVGVMEVVGIAFIVPFMLVITNEDLINKSKKLAFVYDFFHFTSPHNFVIFLGVLVLCMLVIGNILNILSAWLFFKFSGEMTDAIVKKVLWIYLKKDYSFFLNKNVSSLISFLVEDGSHLLWNIIIPFVFTASRVIGLIFIGTLIFAFQPKVSLVLVLVLFGSSLFLYFSTRGKLSSISNIRNDMQIKRARLLDESLHGIREIKIHGMERQVYDTYSNLSNSFLTANTTLNVLSYFPRYLLEILAFGSVVVIILYLTANRITIPELVSFLSLYAFAGYRLMPGVQAVFSSLSSIKAFNATLHSFNKFFDQEKSLHESFIQRNERRLVVRKNIVLQNIKFWYEKKDRLALDNINLEINRGQIVGLVGRTGSGKSTLIDLIVGLLKPSHGKLLIDGHEIQSGDLTVWQNNLGYVSQNTFLKDTTIIENIAFGISKELINHEKIINVCKIVDLHGFIDQELPEKYLTKTGDRGVKLSGGQRQRLAIARALYKDPQVLILDEATSALDTVTEKFILSQILKQDPEKIIIMSAHKMNVIKNFDRVYILQKGRIKNFGTFEELVSFDQDFREMANITQ